jgi:peptide methionine sulfoxide reductase MsrB
MNNVMFILMGMVGGLIAHLIEHAHKRWRIKQLAKDELKTLSKEGGFMAGASKEDAKARREFIWSSRVNEILETRLKYPADTGKILGYAADYLRDHATEHKDVDRHMLERVERICRAGSAHLGDLTAPEKTYMKCEKDKSQEKKDAASVQEPRIP